jgi:hypothetical protein
MNISGRADFSRWTRIWRFAWRLSAEWFAIIIGTRHPRRNTSRQNGEDRREAGDILRHLGHTTLAVHPKTTRAGITRRQKGHRIFREEGHTKIGQRCGFPES